ncbi:hypothetical protein BBJ28_00001154 [Nothophytophthora sp. Chile5]|nr:hypothetical protein BBJ28_00001154 [Nothophytophthora sp. Chile5]
MSFLLPEEDAQAALQAALAFVDACGVSSPVSEGDGVCLDSPTHSTTASHASNKRSRAERHRDRDVRRRLRKKEEKQELQQQAQLLEGRLAKLQRTRHHTSSAGTTVSASTSLIQNKVLARDESVVAFVGPARPKDSIEAELLNISLRKAVNLEIKRSKALGALLDKLPPLQDVQLDSSMRCDALQVKSQWSPSPSPAVCQEDTTRLKPGVFRDNPAALKLETNVVMRQLYDEVKALLDVNAEAETAAASPPAKELLRVKYWRKNGSPEPAHLRNFQARRDCGDGGIEKDFTVNLAFSGESVRLDGIGLMRKFEESDWIAIIWTALFFHESGGICFRERGWMAATRSPTNAAHESVVRSRYRLVAKKVEGSAFAESEDIDRVRNMALGEIGSKMKTKHLLLQKSMLNATGRGDLAAFVSA